MVWPGVSCFSAPHMATFKLTPCKLRDGWLVPKKDSALVETDWAGLVQLLAPSRSYNAVKTLRIGVRPSAYVGLVRQPNGAVTNFVVRNMDLSGDIRGLVKNDPTFSSRFVSAYRVEDAAWDSQVLEAQKTV